MSARAASDKWLDGLAWAAVLALVGVIGLGILVPLYTDEIAIKLIQARFLAEDGRILSLFPQCTAEFARSTPVTWYPAALLHALLYSDLTPIGVRILGVIVALAWLAVTAAWVRLTFGGAGASVRIVAAVATPLSLGVLPLTLVLSRPEQWLLLLVTAFLLLPALLRHAPRWATGWRVGILAPGYLVLVSLLSYAHPKALFFLPLVVVSAWMTFGARHRMLAGAAVVFAVFAAYQSFTFATAVTRCEQAPLLAGLLRAQTTPLSLLAESPSAFAAELAGNVLSAPQQISDHALLKRAHQSGWLPPRPILAATSFEKPINSALTLIIHAVCFLGLFLTPLVLSWRRRKEPEDPGRPLIVALWLGSVGHMALYREWNFYSGALVVALNIYLLAYCLHQLRDLRVVAPAAKPVLAAALALSLLSLSVLTYQLAPTLYGLTQAKDEFLRRQPYSVNAFAFEETRQRILAMGDSCQIRTDRAYRLVVDDLTYFAFDNLREPLHMGFLWERGWGADLVGRTTKFLTDLGSDGMIAQCTFMPAEFQYRTLRDGNLCCTKLK